MYFTVSSSFVGFVGCPEGGNTGMTNGGAADRQPARRIFSGALDPGAAHPSRVQVSVTIGAAVSVRPAAIA
jgi:hypothetical protein